MKRLNRFLFALILTVLCVALAACSSYECEACRDKDPSCPVCSAESTSQSGTEAETPPEIRYFRLTEDTRLVVRGESGSEDMMEALDTVCTAGMSLVGAPLFPVSDGDPVEDGVEILIGYTNRPASIAAATSLTYYDYMYEVVSPECVVICGGGDESTRLAVQKFLLDCYGYEHGVSAGEVRELAVGTSYIYRHEYTAADVTLCGEDIGNFTVVHKGDDAGTYAAFLLRGAISRVTGALPATSTADAFTGGHAIYIGCGTDGEHIYERFNTGHYVVRYTPGAHQTVVIDATSGIGSGEVVNSFAREVLAYVPESGAYDIALPVGDRIYCAALPNEFSGLRLEKAETTTLTDAVRYVKLTYSDENGAPVLAYAAIADLSRVTAINATPNYADAIRNAKATTPQAMKAAEDAGYKVIAGVNADFFAMGGDYRPSGLCVKQGKELNVSQTRPWFGITHEGVPVIATASQYASRYEGKLAEAVGGSDIILKNGFYEDVGDGSEFSYTRHPRTAVGITGDNELIILVVDGRQPKISNGASLTDLAYIMAALGAREALNLDGGGSSTFVTNAATGSFKVCNSPSGGSLRSVYNSLVLVEKE